MQDNNQTFQGNTKYQVWVTSYPTDEENDRGYKLVGQYDNIEEAVQCYMGNKEYASYITKLVTFTTEINDTTDMQDTSMMMTVHSNNTEEEN